ncbi:MAG: ABC transporter [Sphingobium sp.]|nr:ABC transporter [Sphingobium sp.]
MSLAGMTSAMLLAGAPINNGGISLDIPAELIAQAEQDRKAAPAPATVPAPAPLDATVQSREVGENAEHEAMEVMVTVRQRTPGDPLEKLNATSFAVTQAVDKAVVGPVALTFAKIVPTPVRDGLGNFLFNLHEPRVFVNFILQHKIGKAAETFARFFVNTTIGIGGLFDIAKRKPFRLPRRPNGFADTLGFYGVKPGAYLFLPIVGPTTVRDIFGSIADQALLPLAVGSPFNRPAFTLPTSIARTLDHRAYFDEELRRMRSSDKDLYSQRRDLYLQMRQDEIDDLRGRPHTPIRSMPRTTFTRPPSAEAPASPPPLIPAPAPAIPSPK